MQLAETPAGLTGDARGVSVVAETRRWDIEIRDVIRDLIHHWQLVYYLTLRDVQIRYKQAAMGFGWALFMPLMVIGAGLMVQLVLAHAGNPSSSSGSGVSVTAIASTAVKSLPWAFFVGSIQFATGSLTSNMNLVSKVAFPREVLPMSAVLAQAFDSVIGAGALALVLPFLGVRPSLALLWVPLLAVLLLLFTAGAALFLSCANLFYRDIKYIVQLILTFGIFFTPVLFEPAMLGAKAARIIMLNPLAILLEGMRLVVVQGHNLLQPLQVIQKGVPVLAWTPWYLGYAAVWAVVGGIGALLMFRRLQFLFAEFI